MPFEIVHGNAFYKPLRQFLKDLPQDYVGNLAEIQARHGDLVHWKVFKGALNGSVANSRSVRKRGVRGG
jgi:hypothetical protein